MILKKYIEIKKNGQPFFFNRDEGVESGEPEAFPRTKIERGICWIMKPGQALSCLNVTRMLELSQIFNNLVMNSSLGSISPYSTFDIQLNIVRHGMISRSSLSRIQLVVLYQENCSFLSIICVCCWSDIQL